jgi:uncharacterized membrane protein YfcA
MTPLQMAAVAAAGFAAGGINTIVGSGSLITFPTLLAVGLPPVTANVTNTVGLVPGSVSGTIGYRRELRGQGRRTLRLSVVAVAGGILGAVLLLALPSSVFEKVIPFLILLAVVLTAVQPRLAGRLEVRRTQGRDGPVLMVTVFATSVYGGYFGAGQGVILLALLGAFVADRLQRLNAVKNVLTVLVNGAAAVVFVVGSHVRWPVAGVLAIGAVAGGQAGAALGRRIPENALRLAIVIVGLIVSVKLFLDAF